LSGRPGIYSQYGLYTAEFRLALWIAQPFVCFLHPLFNDTFSNVDYIGSVVGSGTMLYAGKSRVLFPMRSLEFSIDLILPATLWPSGRLRLPKKWVPGFFLGLKGNWLTTSPPSVSRLSRECGNLYVWTSTPCYTDGFIFLPYLYLEWLDILSL
jgi:hypothetical protein